MRPRDRCRACRPATRSGRASWVNTNTSDGDHRVADRRQERPEVVEDPVPQAEPDRDGHGDGDPQRGRHRAPDPSVALGRRELLRVVRHPHGDRAARQRAHEEHRHQHDERRAPVLRRGGPDDGLHREDERAQQERAGDRLAPVPERQPDGAQPEEQEDRRRRRSPVAPRPGRAARRRRWPRPPRSAPPEATCGSGSPARRRP